MLENCHSLDALSARSEKLRISRDARRLTRDAIQRRELRELLADRRSENVTTRRERGWLGHLLPARDQG